MQSKNLSRLLRALSRQGLNVSYHNGVYSVHLIETEWHQIKTHELAGRIFEDESDRSDRCY